MRPELELKPEFVEFIPDELEERTVYIAPKYRIAVHKCCCGCGRKVVTPLSPVSWKLTFDGVSISLYPSIGNWNLPCKSHYWIEKNRVKWVAQWTSGQIEVKRVAEERSRAEYYGDEPYQVDPSPMPMAAPVTPESLNADKPAGDKGFWLRIRRWLWG